MPFVKEPIQDFIGKGIIFPIELVKGKPPLQTGFPLIRSSISVILGWLYGTRFMLGEFGSRLKELIEEPNDDVLKTIVEQFVIEAIVKWETRIEQTRASVLRVTLEKVEVQIDYKVVNSQREDSFIYPFYKNIVY